MVEMARHYRLKICCPQGRPGSSPGAPTKNYLPLGDVALGYQCNGCGSEYPVPPRLGWADLVKHQLNP